MDDDTATLEVGFAINAGTSFAEIERLQAFMQTAEFKAIKSADQMEKAFNGLSLSGASAQVEAFGGVTTREMARAEKAADRLTRQLTRQAEEFGKTAAQIRDMKVDKAAADLERLGNSADAASLRALNAELDLLEANAGKTTVAINGNRGAMAALAPQAQDMFTQISMGTNVLNVLAIQGGQAAGQMVHLEGAAGKFGQFMMGPWGLAITGGLLVLGALTKGMFDNEEAAEAAEAALKKFQDRQSDIGNFIDATTGKLVEQNRTLVLNAILTRQANIAANDKAISEGRKAAFDRAGEFKANGPSAGVGTGGASLMSMRVVDPDVSKAIAAAGGDVDKLAASIANLATTTRPDLKKLALDITGQAGAAIIATRENKKLGEELRALNGNSSALANGTTALIEKQVALTTATTPLTRARAQLAIVQQGAAAADRIGGAALVKYREDLTAATKAVNVAEAAQKAASDARRAGTREANRAAAEARRDANRAAGLARDDDAINAQINNLYALANAYDVSGAAALIAEARVKAESAAIKDRGDIEAAVDRQIRLSVAQRVAEASKGAVTMREQARVQTDLNAAVAAGEISAEQANELMRERIAELPLLAALEVAQQRGLKTEVEAATKALQGQRSAAADARAAATGAFFTGAAADTERRLAVLDAEYKLTGATNLERARGLAVVRAEQELKAKGQPLGTPYANGFIGDAVKVAEQTERNTAATREWTDSIYAVSDAWDLIARNVQQAASGMADAFGPVGRAIGDVASIYANFSAQQERASAVHKEALRNASTQTAKDRENARFALANSTAQVGMYGDMAAAAKGFFKEKSAGYQAMMVAEKVFRAFEFAMSVRSMVQDVAETFASVANSGARATAAGAEGIANQSKLPFPFNIAAMAATGAALVAAGIAVLSGGGGGRNSAPVSNTGTGTVLGDKDAQSESIKRSLDLLRDVDTLMLTESRRMAASLRSIDSQIGGLAAVLVRSGNLNADSQVAQGFKPNAIGSVLGSIPIVGGLLGSLFGSKTKVIGSGIYGGAMSLDAILAGAGYNAQTYSDVEKKKKFFGITTSTKFSTVYGGAVDSSVSDQFGLILRSFNDAILAAAGPLGNATDEIKSRLSGFIFSLGKIDLTGLSGSEIQEKLAAVFGAAADNMAEAAFPGISRFQKVGEGAFETLVRVSSTVEAVSTTLDSLGKAAIGLSIDAKVALANQFDTIGDFTSAAQSYFDAFYTKEEQASARAAQLTRVFGSMNLVMPRTLTGFRQLVDAQDLTTDAGRAAYATLLQLAPAFSDLMGSLGGAKTAADAAADLREAWTSIGDSIADEVKRIRALNNTGSSASFAQLQGRFNAATTGARGGNQDMARMLPQLSQDLLAAAERQATSRQELDRIRALTAASLEETNASIISRTNALTLDELLDRTATAQAASTRQAANDVVAATNDQTAALRDELAGMREDLTSVLASIAGNTDKTATILRDVTPDGDTLAIRTA